jgi:hypothetical protein
MSVGSTATPAQAIRDTFAPQLATKIVTLIATQMALASVLLRFLSCGR